MPRVLKDIRITEVSSVDRGAGEGVKVMLMKRDDPKAETKMTDAEITAAIAKQVTTSVAPLNEQIAKLSTENAILKMSPTHRAYYDKCATDEIKKVFRETADADRDAYMKAHPHAEPAKVSDDPAVQDVVKRAAALATENDDLKKRLGVIEERETKAEFAKRAVGLGLQEADGEIMRKAYAGDKAAQADLDKRIGEITKAAEEIARTAGVFKEFGQAGGGRGGATAEGEIKAKAEEYRKSADGAKLSYQQAYARVMADPANADLAKRVRDEEIAKRDSRAAA